MQEEIFVVQSHQACGICYSSPGKLIGAEPCLSLPACQYKRCKTRLAPWKKSYDRPRQHIRKQRNHFANKGPYSQSYGLSSSHVWMWELDYKESWALKNWCFQIVVPEKTLESILDCKEIKQVNLRRNQPSMFIGRTDAEAEAPILWPLDEKSWLTGKFPDAEKDWRRQQRMRWLEALLMQWTWVWANSGR